MTSQTATVRCPVCNDLREISVRQRRRLANSGKTFTCSMCRWVPPKIEIREEHRLYWLERYPPEWIAQVGSSIWGRRT
jgi:hypothetical protein